MFPVARVEMICTLKFSLADLVLQGILSAQIFFKYPYHIKICQCLTCSDVGIKYFVFYFYFSVFIWHYLIVDHR